MNAMKQIELGEEQALAFAKEALETRFDKKSNESY
jgi:hypothetical protein